MLSKQQCVAKSNISPVLFMGLDGEPMSFFLRPGPIKRKFQPLILAGGGVLHNVQQPGAILLIDPGEVASIPTTTTHRYVSTQYIHDCIEKNEQLDLQNYRLNPGMATGSADALNSTKKSGLGGRLPYTEEEDAAILSFVNKHKTEIGGNRLWQEMEKQHVTSHSWQSMKYRYRVRLGKIQSEAVEVTATEGEPEPADGENKIDTSSVSSEIVQLESSEGPQTELQPAESTKGEPEVETLTSAQPEESHVDPPAESQPLAAETAESQTMVSPPSEAVPEDCSPAQPELQLETHCQPREKTKSSPRSEPRQRPLTRRQLQLEECLSPEQYNEKLSSSENSAQQPSPSPQRTKKTKLAKSAHQKDESMEQPPSKKAKVGNVPVMLENQEENSQATVSETPQKDTETISVPQKAGKENEKRNLGILEMATKEFEDDSESDEDEALEPQNPTETAMFQLSPRETEGPHITASTTPSTRSSPEPDPKPRLGLQENLEQVQASCSNCPPPGGYTEANTATSKAHLFIFDHESQEDQDSHSTLDGGTAPANPEPTVNTDTAFALTQAQLEEDKQRITELMNETKQDLVSVTKALLQTSGDFSDARDLLLNSFSSGPLWRCCDDDLLMSGDPTVRQQLQGKYGEEILAKRIVFLELEA